MVIDRERVKQAFQEYTGRYDIHDEKIRLKVEHTYRVADISEQIAEKFGGRYCIGMADRNVT